MLLYVFLEEEEVVVVENEVVRKMIFIGGLGFRRVIFYGMIRILGCFFFGFFCFGVELCFIFCLRDLGEKLFGRILLIIIF